MNKEEKDLINNILDSMPNKFRIIEQGITEKSYEEYYQIEEQIEGFHTDEEILEEAKKWTKNHDGQITKKLLVKLSMIASVESYRRIEQIIEESNKEIKKIGFLCLKQSRLFLENSLSDEPVGFISTGLGGKDNKLRYEVIVTPKVKPDQKDMIQLNNVIESASKNMDIELEFMDNHSTYLRLRMLVSMDEALANVVDYIISHTNFLNEEYMCSNVEKINEEEIKKWLKVP